MRAQGWILLGLAFLIGVFLFRTSPTITGRFVDEPTERVVVILNQEPSAVTDIVLEDVNSPGVIGKIIGVPDNVVPERTMETLPVMVVEATAEGIEKLEAHPLVDVVIPDVQLQLYLAQSVPLINADDVNNIALGGQNLKGQGMSACVLDTGIQADHPAFEGRVVAQKCYCASNCCPNGLSEDNLAVDTHSVSHGTHVSGIIGSNGTYKGVAPAANIVAVKVCSSSCSLSDIVSGMDFCVTNKDTYNIKVMSGSFGDSGNYQTQSSCPTYLDSSIDAAYSAGIAGVFASGNSGYSNGVGYPACSPNAISVGATDKNDVLPSFSNRGPLLEILAPGVAITSTKSGSSYLALSGTSQSTPHVSGVILLLQQYAFLTAQTFTVDQLKDALISSNVTVNGYPRVDALAALEYLGYNATNSTNPIPLNITIISPLPNATEFSNGTLLSAEVSGNSTAASVEWSSNISGILGIGFSSTVNLTPGEHLIFANASVANETASANVSINVLEAEVNEPLNININSPPDNSTFFANETVLLSAHVTGNESDVNVSWTSNNSGTIAFGSIAFVNLSVGSHLITANTSENDELSEASVIVNILSPPESPVNISISIVEPQHGATLLSNGTNFVAFLSPSNVSVVWSSNVSGTLGNGANITVNLSAGKHKITSLATYGTSSANASISVNVVSATCLLDIDLNNNADVDVGDMILLLTAYNSNSISCLPSASPGECVVDLNQNNDNAFNAGDIIVLLGKILAGSLSDIFGSPC